MKLKSNFSIRAHVYKITQLSFFLFLVLGLASCGNQMVINEYKDYDNGSWHEDSVANFDFDVADLETAHDINFNIRYNLDYPNYNLYVRYKLKDSLQNEITQGLYEATLFDSKTGIPTGAGIGDLRDAAVLVLDDYSFPYKGKYALEIQQYMRTESLLGIYGIGLSIETISED